MYYILNTTNKFYKIWNWGIREFAFDVDGEYDESTRFGYSNRYYAYKIARKLMRTTPELQLEVVNFDDLKQRLRDESRNY